MLSPTMHKRQPAASALIYFIKMVFIYSMTLFYIYYIIIHSPWTKPYLSWLHGKTTRQVDTPAPPLPRFIPKKIWYVLKEDDEMDDEARRRVAGCMERNPSHEVQIIVNDESADDMVWEAFANERPDIVDSYADLSSVPVLQVAVLRYLLLYAEGGVVLGPDVSCGNIGDDDDDDATKLSMEEWVPVPWRDRAQLVVAEPPGEEGLDDAEAELLHRQPYLSNRAAIMAWPRSHHVLVVIDHMLQGLRRKAAEHHVADMSDLTPSMIEDVLDLATPRAIIENIFKSLNTSLSEEMANQYDEDGRPEPILVQDVLIVPVDSDYEPVGNKGPQELK